MKTPLAFSKMRRTSPILASLALGFTVSCGDKEKSQEQGSCSVPGGESREELRRPHFVTLDLAGGQKGSSIVYRFNSSTMEAKQVAVRGSGSQDTLVLRDTKFEDVLMVERLNPRSRLTRLSCLQDGWPTEFGRLPANVFGLGYFGAENMVALGWNNGSLANFSRDLKTSLKEDVRPRPLGTLSLSDADYRFNNFLVSSNGSPFVLSSGQVDGSGGPTSAKLLKLDSSLTQVESQWTIPGCFNAFQQYSLQLGPSDIVLGCNPLWNGPNGYPVSLVRVTLDASGNPSFLNLNANISGDAQLLVPGGSTRDKTSIFITEMADLKVNGRSFPPGRYLRSYWLDLKTGQRRDMMNLAGSVIFDDVEKKYIWSCVVDPASGQCQDKRFGVGLESSWDQVQSVNVYPVKFDHRFFEFEREVY